MEKRRGSRGARTGRHPAGARPARAGPGRTRERGGAARRGRHVERQTPLDHLDWNTACGGGGGGGGGAPPARDCRGRERAQACRRAPEPPRLLRHAHRPAQPRAAARSLAASDGEGRPRRPPGRGPVPRPRPLQGHQRHPRPPSGRRPAQGRGRTAQGLPAGGRHHRAARGRRVHGGARRRGARGQRDARRAQDSRQLHAAVPRGRPRPFHRRLDRHHALSLRRARRRGPAQERRRRHVPRQGVGPRHLPVLHRRSQRARRAPAGARNRAASGPRKKPALAALPAAGGPQVRPHHRHGGAGALAAPGTGAVSPDRSSSPSPRRPDSSCRSASGRCARPAARSRRGTRPASRNCRWR